MSEAVTNGVRVEVHSEYIDEESDPSQQYFFFTYHIKISNEGSAVVQLKSRHWIITNADGRTEEVKGPGVVGAQPILRPGESFSYTSYCPLRTPIGTMHGSYQMLEDGERFFNADIPAFRLAIPNILQ